jgi:hypothetical protein
MKIQVSVMRIKFIPILELGGSVYHQSNIMLGQQYHSYAKQKKCSEDHTIQNFFTSKFELLIQALRINEALLQFSNTAPTFWGLYGRIGGSSWNSVPLSEKFEVMNKCFH